MHDDFADWYRAATVDPADIPLESRWSALEQLTADLDADRVLEITRIYYGLDNEDSQSLNSFRSVFKSTDPAFRMRENDLEVRVLAGATLVQLLASRRISLAQLAALAIVAGSFAEARKQVGVEDLVQRGRAFLARRSVERKRLAREPQKSPKLDAEELAEKITAAGNTGAPQQLGAATADAIRPLVEAVDELRNRLSRALRELGHSQRFLEEETNVLWWVFGGWSRDLETRFDELGFPAVTIIAGKELADLASGPPGPLAAEALLDKALRQSRAKPPKTTTLKEAVNAAPRDWRRSLVRRAAPHLDALTPALLAIAKSLETDGTDDWLPAYERLSGIDANRDLEPLELAGAVYQEEMLLRSLGDT